MMKQNILPEEKVTTIYCPNMQNKIKLFWENDGEWFDLCAPKT